MSTVDPIAGAAAPGAAGGARPRLGRIYLLEAKYELLKLARLPAYALPTIAFPVLFYVLFAVTFGSGRTVGGVDAAAALLAGYGAFGVIGAALFGFGVGVAVERGQGWTLLKRASPMPPGAYLAAKAVASILFAAVIVALMSLLAAALVGVRMPAGDWLLLAAVLVPGTLPFCAMGLAFGTLCGPNSAPAIVNLAYLPMAFASGLWIPVGMLPGFVRTIAPWMPPYHLGQLALKVVGADVGRPVWLHLGALAAVTALSFAVAVYGWRRGEERTYG